jgi:hypothetical protein
MAAPLEPAVIIQAAKQNNFKRKLSQENNNVSPNQADQDTDDRQWSSKNRQFYQNKNKNSFINNFNDDISSNNQDENYQNNDYENENGNNNFNQFNNTNRNMNRGNSTRNRGNYNNNNNNFNNKKFNDVRCFFLKSLRLMHKKIKKLKYLL